MAKEHRINDIYTLCDVSMLYNRKCNKVQIDGRTTFKNNVHFFLSLTSVETYLLFWFNKTIFYLSLSANLSCRNIHLPISPSEVNSFYSNSAVERIGG